MVGDAGDFWRRATSMPVVHIGRIDTAALADLFHQSPPDAPAGLIWSPPIDPDITSSLVAAALAELEGVATRLFPSWLPGAEGIDSRGGANEEAVRRIALRQGASSTQFGPYLAALAVRALPPPLPEAVSGFQPEVRARGVVQVLTTAYRRRLLVLGLDLPDALTPRQEDVVVAAVEFLASHGRLRIWLLGPRLRHTDRVPSARIPLPGPLPVEPDDERRERCWFPPVGGRPHPASSCEQALEAALARLEWAAGRSWNQHYAPDPLLPPVRLDLAWPAERLVVEIDGPEHRHPLRYEADRRRDLRLTLDGYTVVRFTNAYLTEDLGRAVTDIEQLLSLRRNDLAKGPL